MRLILNKLSPFFIFLGCKGRGREWRKKTECAAKASPLKWCRWRSQRTYHMRNRDNLNLRCLLCLPSHQPVLPSLNMTISRQVTRRSFDTFQTTLRSWLGERRQFFGGHTLFTADSAIITEHLSPRYDDALSQRRLHARHASGTNVTLP